jgi:AdoMet-dependent rRNA methyltransferase SPB1
MSLDKWYKLAKEKGYRDRAAFKLIQLNKKYGFLEKSRVLLDLCAAPGSWTQVAAEVMPAQSLIIGVDLAPIKPIPRAITFQSDITTDKCRSTIRQHIKHLKADTVLHDGAPNVGVAWVQDAYSQAELVLQSLKLATEFLKEGGTFVTKVFRSKDYNALLWVFKQLFSFVEATKPPSSRNVSAEIFVICRGYKAPKKMDPKFLDPRHVFAEVQEPTPNNEAKVFNPEKKKRKREGYEEGDYTQHKEISVSEFIHTTDPIAILGTVNKLSFEQSANGDLALATLERLPETTEEIKLCCADLKVLGRKDFRNLLRWRLKVRDKFGMSAKAKKKEEKEQEAQAGEEVAEIESMDEEMKIQEEMQRLKDQENSRKKKERRKENERKQKEVVRMQMHMTAPHDIGLEQAGPNGDDAMFNLKTADKVVASDKVADVHVENAYEESESSEDESESEEDSDEDGDRLDRELDTMYEAYQQRREENDAKQRAKRARKERATDEWEGLSGDDLGEGGATTDVDSDVDDSFTVRTVPRTEGLSTKAAMFFDQDIFQGLGISDPADGNDSAIEMDDDIEAVEKPDTLTASRTQKAASQNQKKVKKAPKSILKLQNTTEQDSGDDLEPAPTTNSTQHVSDPPVDPIKHNGQLDIDIITAEAMTLAHSLATGAKSSTDIIDDSFNKYSHRDTDGLPSWFLDDENRHSRPHRPVTAAAAAAIKEKLRALNARPIKKVREAKGRKKMRAAARLEKLKKKSALLADDEGVSERDKAGMISKMMARASKKGKPKEKVKVVVAKGGNRGIQGRPKGVKGRYKIVDARLKKDVRGEKRAAKKNKK